MKKPSNPCFLPSFLLGIKGIVMAIWAVSGMVHAGETDVVTRVYADFRGENPPMRANRDIPFACDLSDADGLSFDLRVDDLSEFSSFSFYFWFGDGSYSGQGLYPTREGEWARMTVKRPEKASEAKWKSVRGFRLSGWRGGTNDTFVGVRNIAIMPKGSIREPDEKMAAGLRAEVKRVNTAALARLAAVPPPVGERRFVWAHSPHGLHNRTWRQAARFLKEYGFTDLIVNMVNGSTGAYHSSVLIWSDLAQGHDCLQECLDACRAEGIKVHAWNVCWGGGWRLDEATQSRFFADGRYQISFDGKMPPKRWLCPTHPANRRLIVESMLELASKGVDGVHFDYIRYPDNDYCFCQRCHRLFERKAGGLIQDWPNALRRDNRLKTLWRQFRCEAITAPLREVAQTLHADPSNRCEVSAAVFRDPLSDPDYVGQDWAAWCREGYLDFVCPMTYEEDFGWFRRKLDKEARQVPGNVPQYPGIGLGVWKRDGREIERFCDQVCYVREIGRGGFAVFELNWKLEQLMPQVGTALGLSKETRER